MLHREPILVSLSPMGVRVGVIAGGEIARVHREALDPDSYDSAWQSDLKPFDEALRSALKALSIRPGSPALIVYQSQRAMCEVFGAPTTGHAAIQAAALYLQQTLPGAARGWLTARRILSGVDPAPGAAVGSMTGAGAAKTMMLTHAEVAPDADVLVRWARRCGVRTQGVLPAKVAHLIEALRAPEHDPQERSVITLRLDEQTFTMVGWMGGKLAFARSADVGYGLLAEAFARSGRALAGPETMTREHATRLLFTIGVPERGRSVDPRLGLSSDAVLPLVLPAVQRFCIEVRQTLRFSMPEPELARARLRFSGAGALVPGLLDAIASHLELSIEPAQAQAGSSGVTEDQAGDLPAALALRKDDNLWLTPPLVAAQHAQRRLTQASRVGAIAVALALATFAGLSLLEISRMRERVRELTPLVEAADARALARQQAFTLAGSVRSGAALLDQTLADRPSWVGVFATLSDARSLGVEFLDVSCDKGDAALRTPLLTLRGRVVRSGQDGTDAVSRLVEHLNASRFTADARVLSSRIDTSGDEPTREFVVTARLSGVPATGELFSSITASAADGAGEPLPGGSQTP